MVNSRLCKNPVSKFVIETYENVRLRDPPKRFQNFEIGPKLSETHVFQGTILTTPPGLKQFV